MAGFLPKITDFMACYSQMRKNNILDGEYILAHNFNMFSAKEFCFCWGVRWIA